MKPRSDATLFAVPTPPTTRRLPSERTAIIVDAACDIPGEYLRRPGMMLLPTLVSTDGYEYTDNRDVATIRSYLRDQKANGNGANAITSAQSVDAMRELFVERLALDYDSVYCLTVSSKRSEIYGNASRAAVQALSDARKIREAAGISRPFQLRVIDTKNLFAGQAIPLYELMDMLDAGMSPREITPRLFAVADATYGYLVPDDLTHLRTRARKRGDRSVGLFGAMIGNALDIRPVVRAHMGLTAPVAKIRGREEAVRRLFRFVGSRVSAGLHTPHVSLSYGGELEELRSMPGYAELASICDVANVQLHESMMSITGCVNVGPRAVAIAFAGPPHIATF